MSCEWKHVYTCKMAISLYLLLHICYTEIKKKTGYSERHAMDFWDSNWFLLYSDCIVFVDNQMHISKKNKRLLTYWTFI